jgi:hypothetical protein
MVGLFIPRVNYCQLFTTFSQTMKSIVEPSGKEKKIKLPDICPDPVMDLDEMILILTQAGYLVHKSNPDI